MDSLLLFLIVFLFQYSIITFFRITYRDYYWNLEKYNSYLHYLRLKFLRF